MKLQKLLETNMIGLAMILLINWGPRTSSALPTDLTAEDGVTIKPSLELSPNAASAHAILEVPIPSHRKSIDMSILEVDIIDLWTGEVANHIKFQATEGILANKDTPVWNATSLSEGLFDTEYNRNHEAMKLLGEFTFYQNYENRAAIVYFHRDNTIRGKIGGQLITQTIQTNGTRNTHFRRYLLVEDSTYEIPSFMSQDGNLTEDYDTPRPGPFPDVVYPQFLISVDYDYVQDGIVDALSEILTLMNLVDMLFSTVSQPKIKLNIAGIIIPTNYAATPWLSKCESGETGICDHETLYAADTHFKHYSESVFTDNSWDAVLVLVSKPLGDRYQPAKTYLGLTGDLSCINKWGNYKVSLLSAYGYLSSATVAHEIAHFFEVQHDTATKCPKVAIMSSNIDYSPQALMWSPCSLRAMTSYFGKAKSMCLDNLPKTLMIPHNLVPIEPDSVCEGLGAGSYDGVVECNGLVKCTSSNDTKIGPPDGTVCSNIGDSKRVCYNGQCLPYTDASRYDNTI